MDMPAEDPTARIKSYLQVYDPHERYLRRRILEAGRMLTSHSGVERSVAEAVAREIYDLYLGTYIQELREQAGAILRSLLDGDLSPAILEWISSTWGKYKLHRLGDLAKHPGVRDILLDWARNYKWLDGLMVAALEPAGAQPEVRDTLLNLLKHSKEEVREYACRALTPAAGEPFVRDALIAMLNDPGAHVPRYAALALGPHASDPVILAALRPFYEQKEWRRYGWIEDVFRASASGPGVLELLQEVLGDPEWKIRRTVVLTLAGAATNLGVQQVLLQTLQDSESQVRRVAIYALKSVAGEPSVQEALLGMFTDADPAVRADASHALRHVLEQKRSTEDNLPSLERPLREALDSPRHTIRTAAALTLAPLAGEVYINKKLVDLLQDPSPEVRGAAASSLVAAHTGSSGPEAGNVTTGQSEGDVTADGDGAVGRATRTLIALMHAQKGRVRALTAYGLRPLAHREDIHALLIPMLHDPSPFVRYSATLSLYRRTEDPLVQRAYLKLLTSYNEGQAAAALESLAEAPPTPWLTSVVARCLSGAFPLSGTGDVAYRVLSQWADCGAEHKEVSAGARLDGVPAQADDDIYEPFLHQGLLQEGRDLAALLNAPGQAEGDAGGVVSAESVVGRADAVARQLFSLMMQTQVRSLVVEAGEVLWLLLDTPAAEFIRALGREAVYSARHIARLGELSRDPLIRTALLERVGDSEWKVRKAVARALGPVADQLEVEAALLAMLSDQSSQVRKTVAGLLRTVASRPPVRDALLRCLHDPTDSVLWYVSWALMPVAGEPVVRSTCLQMLTEGLDRSRPFAARILEAAPLAGTEARDHLISLLSHTEMGVRSAALSVLGSMSGEPEVVHALLPLLKDPEPRVRLQALGVLGRSATVHGVAGAAEALLALLDDTDNDTREQTVRALALRTNQAAGGADGVATSAVDGRAAVEPAIWARMRDALLSRAKGDSFWRVRLWAIEGLRFVVDEESVRNMLHGALNDANQHVSDRAAEVLATQTVGVGEAGLWESLLERLQSSEWRVQQDAIAALGGQVTAPDAQEVLRKLLSAYEEVRRTRTLTGDEWRLRLRLAWALAQSGYDPLAWQPLREQLISGEHSNQQGAAQAAAPMAKNPVVRDALRPLLTDNGALGYVQEAAAHALKYAVPDAWMVPPLGALLEGPYAEAAEAAYTTLLQWATGNPTLRTLAGHSLLPPT